MDPSSFMMDMDLGEMFYNFPMHSSIQPFCGLDLRPYLDPASKRTIWERWCRCMMGWVAAPYLATKYQLLDDEVTQGDRLDKTNPFQWVKVILNLPSLTTYDPTQPWVYRITSTGAKCSGGPTYVDGRCENGRLKPSTLLGCITPVFHHTSIPRDTGSHKKNTPTKSIPWCLGRDSGFCLP
jgi:hypothetical protein